MARTVTWVRLLRTRLPAFDGMDAGDLALIPLNTLRSVAPDEAARREMVEYLADHNATGILAIASEGSSKDEDAALKHLVAAAAVTRLPCLLGRGAEPAQLERSLIGAVVNRRAELERQAVALERQIAALALDGQGLDALIGALAAFIGRAVALEAPRRRRRSRATWGSIAPKGNASHSPRFLARQTRSDTATANARRMKSRHSVMTLMSDQVLLSCSVMSRLVSATALPVSAWRHSLR
jgi:purine catabolism regulator